MPSEKCCQKPVCDALPVSKVYWPGREPVFMCLKHAAAAQRISDAMGFFLVIEEHQPSEHSDAE